MHTRKKKKPPKNLSKTLTLGSQDAHINTHTLALALVHAYAPGQASAHAFL